MGLLILTIGIIIVLAIDLGCFLLLSKVKGPWGVSNHQFRLPCYSIYAYYKYKKEHIK
jgi:hypothetical protein